MAQIAGHTTLSFVTCVRPTATIPRSSLIKHRLLLRRRRAFLAPQDSHASVAPLIDVCDSGRSSRGRASSSARKPSLDRVMNVR